MTRIIATSDLHGILPAIPECDILILAGDICIEGSLTDQEKWLDTTFRNWLDRLPAKEIVLVAGNHDYLFEQTPNRIPENLRVHYLKDQIVTLFNISIYGSPWQLPFYGAFNLSEGRLRAIYAQIPEHTDIIVSHAPPYGICDSINGEATGSRSLRERIFQIKPKLCIFGHIHSAFGIHKEEGILFANVAYLDNDLNVQNKPNTFSI